MVNQLNNVKMDSDFDSKLINGKSKNISKKILIDKKEFPFFFCSIFSESDS